MTDPSLAIQNAVEATLRADAGVKAQFTGGTTRLYTMSAPNDAPYPYIIIGEDQIVGDDTECASSSDVFVTVHIWVREDTPKASREKVKAIAGAVRTALTAQLTLAGHVMDDWLYQGTQHLTDSDGLTAHSVLTFEYLTTATA